MSLACPLYTGCPPDGCFPFPHVSFPLETHSGAHSQGALEDPSRRPRPGAQDGASSEVPPARRQHRSAGWEARRASSPAAACLRCPWQPAGALLQAVCRTPAEQKTLKQGVQNTAATKSTKKATSHIWPQRLFRGARPSQGLPGTALPSLCCTSGLALIQRIKSVILLSVECL